MIKELVLICVYVLCCVSVVKCYILLCCMPTVMLHVMLHYAILYYVVTHNTIADQCIK